MWINKNVLDHLPCLLAQFVQVLSPCTHVCCGGAADDDHDDGDDALTFFLYFALKKEGKYIKSGHQTPEEIYEAVYVAKTLR